MWTAVERARGRSLCGRGIKSHPQTLDATPPLQVRGRSRFALNPSFHPVLIALFSIAGGGGERNRFDRTIVILFAVQVRYQRVDRTAACSPLRAAKLIARQRYRIYLPLLLPPPPRMAENNGGSERIEKETIGSRRCLSVRGSFQCYSFRAFVYATIQTPFVRQVISDLCQRDDKWKIFR